MEVFKRKQENRFLSLLCWLVDGYWPEPDQRDESRASVQGPNRSYTPQRLLAVGDVADSLLSTAESYVSITTETDYLLKVSRVPEGHALLDIERKALTDLLTAAGATTYR